MLYLPWDIRKDKTGEAALVGHVKRDVDRSRYLFDLFDYENLPSMKRAIRSILKLEIRAEAGCPTSAAILVDLKTALGAYGVDELLGRRVLTQRQKDAIILHLVLDKTIQETAAILGIDPTGVTHRINGGIKRIIQFLKAGEIGPREWEPWEVDYLRRHYYTMGAKAVAEYLDRPLTQVYAKARHTACLSKGA